MMYTHAWFGLWAEVHGLFVIAGLAVYVASSQTLRLRRHPSAAVAWVVALVLLPYIALPLYLMFGVRKIRNNRPAVTLPATVMQVPSDMLTARTRQLADIMALPDAASYSQLRIHADGTQALQSLRDVIAGATRTLDICTYIFARDSLGDEIAAILLHRAREGVRVRLLVDGLGAYLGGHRNFRMLAAAGVQVVHFVPPLSSPLPGRTNLRNHRKLLVADGTWLWSGGRNLACEYFEGDMDAAKVPWLDLSFDLQGILAQQAQQLFDQDWAFATGDRVPVAVPAPVAEAKAIQTVGQLIASGPDQVDDTLYTLLISGFFVSRRHIQLVTPYFVPDSTLLMSLTLAARRGVVVDLILPQRSNHRLADMARHRALRELTQAGAHVWFVPGMLHAKAVVIDDEIALVGSANLDERSLFLNYELMFAFYDAGEVRRFAQWMERVQVSAKAYRVQPLSVWEELREGLLLWLAFQL